MSAERVSLQTLDDPGTAAAVLDPLRLRILEAAQEPASAATIALSLSLPRQRVNYHVKALAAAGLLRKAGTRKKRNMVEQRYVASARSYVIAPKVLGPMAADPRDIADPLSAAHLISLAARTQDEVATAARQAAAVDKRLATMSIAADVRFCSAKQRAAFARALSAAITEVVAAHASAFADEAGTPAKGRPYRLVVGCHPIPKPEPQDSP